MRPVLLRLHACMQALRDAAQRSSALSIIHAMAAQRRAGGRKKQTTVDEQRLKRHSLCVRAHIFVPCVCASSGGILVLSGLYLRIIRTYAHACMVCVQIVGQSLEECVGSHLKNVWLSRREGTLRWLGVYAGDETLTVPLYSYMHGSPNKLLIGCCRHIC